MDKEQIRQRWRPFASAPMDETEILVYRPDAGVFTAHYYPSINEDGERDIDNYCWFTTAGEDLTGDLPTHWMPLPDGPDAAETERTRGPWEADEHHNLGTIGSPKSWKYVKHNFPNAPYEGELENEWGIYPPLGQSGPVALVAGKANAEFIVTACNAHDDLLTALDAAEARVTRMRKALDQVIEGDQGWNFAGDTSLADIARDALTPTTDATEVALTEAGQRIERLQRQVFELKDELAVVKRTAITEERVAEAVKDTLKYRESTEHLPDWLLDSIAEEVVNSLAAHLKEGK